MAPLMLFFSIPLLLLLVFLSYRALFPAPTYSNSPPCPRGLPILGNLLQLGSLPHRSLQSLAQSHAAPLMYVRIGGGAPTLIVSSADAARQVLKTHDLAFSSRPFSKATALLSYGPRNVTFSAYGEYWRLAKKAAVVHLLSPKRVLSFRPLREEHLALMLSKISSSVAEGRAVDLSGVLQMYSHGLIIAAATGRGTAAVEGIREMMNESSVLLPGFQVFEALPWLGWMTRLTGMDARLARLARRWDGFLSSVVEEHAAAARGGEEEELDFVGVLMELRKNGTGDFMSSEKDIKSITLDMIAAGTDTSYIVLEWAMAELLRNPREMKEAQHEVKQLFSKEKPTLSEDDVHQLTYLKAVVKETLRLHPPAPLLLPRESTSYTTVQGFGIPSKTQVIINAWAIARDPMSWEFPEEFKPERFLGSNVDYKGLDFQLIPFGTGRRVCPGMHFAVTSIELALANLLYCFDWELPEGMRPEDMDMAEAAGLTNPKKVSLRVIAKPHSV